MDGGGLATLFVKAPKPEPKPRGKFNQKISSDRQGASKDELLGQSETDGKNSTDEDVLKRDGAKIIPFPTQFSPVTPTENS